jgi:hypothetical protein
MHENGVKKGKRMKMGRVGESAYILPFEWVQYK